MPIPAFEIKNSNSSIRPLLILWFLINLVQASLTELSYDEAYYWMYSRFLDWGYFDHPPMIALLDFVGFGIIPNEIGVRLPSIILTTGSIYIIFLLARPKSLILFGSIIFSTLALSIIGFISLPDSPLLFFTCLFFLQYRKYLHEPTFSKAILIGIVGAALLYSKYHGLLVLLFTLLSNWRIILKKHFWLIPLITIACLIPHIMWQFDNGFPSIAYHLKERTSTYTLKYTYGYLAQQLFFFYGIGGGLIMLYYTTKQQVLNSFEKGLKFTTIGFFLFFLIMSTRGRTEANWTLPALPGLIYFTIQYLDNNIQHKKILKKVFLTLTVIPLILRFHVLYPVVDIREDKVKEFRGWADFNKVLESRAGDLPLVFTRYQFASKYTFYSGKYAPVISVNSRESQYNLWEHLIKPVEGKRCMLMSNFINYGKPVNTPLGEKYHLVPIKKLPNYSNIELICPNEPVLFKASKKPFLLPITIVSNGATPIGNYESRIFQNLTDSKGKVYDWYINKKSINQNLISDSSTVSLKMTNPNKPGNYKAHFSVVTDSVGYWSCHCNVNVVIE